ncbi:helix-turn-helix domain-containing protein [Brevundimonas sp.]|jgi:DNA-binding HxlR family transcriptional regulator|uniref:winged helix-turn-helix transcriptional regulator n=1 Tax=Brevundimonas sp. TaxID=1871086 RepID=UPI0028A8F441|nr:helix-turn-helix domain-containing protein [Brevundimonas sp.]
MREDDARPCFLDMDIPQPKRPDDCPVEDWLAFLGHRWNALILWHLNTGEKRHGDLMALLPGVSPKVLSERLEGLERRELVARHPLRSFPRGVIYSLTPRGSSLVAVLNQLEVWLRHSHRASER